MNFYTSAGDKDINSGLPAASVNLSDAEKCNNSTSSSLNNDIMILGTFYVYLLNLSRFP